MTEQGARAAASSPCGNWGRRGTLAAALAVLFLFCGMSVAQAKETSVGSASTAIGTDTLNPPTNFKVTTACSLLSFLTPSTVTLTWTATPDTYATGYLVKANGTAQPGVAGRGTSSVGYQISNNTSYTFSIYAVTAGKWTSIAVSSAAVQCMGL